MSRAVGGAVETFDATSDLARGLRVKLSSGVLAASGTTEDDLGTVVERYESSGLGASGKCAVLLKNAEGARYMIASAAITLGAAVEKAASGKVVTFSAGERVGIALSASTADGDEITVLPDGWA